MAESPAARLAAFFEERLAAVPQAEADRMFADAMDALTRRGTKMPDDYDPEATVAALQEAVDRLTKERDEARSKADGSVAAWDEATEDAKIFVRERDEARAEVGRLRRENERLDKACDARERERDEAHERIQDLSREVERLTRERDEARTKAERLAKERDEALVDRLTSIRDQFVQERDEAQHQAALASGYQAAYIEARKERDEANARAEAAERKRDELQRYNAVLVRCGEAQQEHLTWMIEQEAGPAVWATKRRGALMQERNEARAEAELLRAIIKGVHGALADAGDVPVPALDADLYDAVMVLVRQRDEARAIIAAHEEEIGELQVRVQTLLAGEPPEQP